MFLPLMSVWELLSLGCDWNLGCLRAAQRVARRAVKVSHLDPLGGGVEEGERK